MEPEQRSEMQAFPSPNPPPRPAAGAHEPDQARPPGSDRPPDVADAVTPDEAEEVDALFRDDELPPEPSADTGDASPTSGEPKRRHGLRRFFPRPVIRIGRLLLVALVVEYLVLPQIAGTRAALHTLASVNPLLLLAGFALEAAAIASYTGLTRNVLPAGSYPGFFRLLRIQLSTLSVSHCVPGGSAAGSTLGYRLLTSSGADRTDVGFALATQSLGSAVVLNAIFWVALVVSLPVWGFNPLYLTAAVIGALLVGGFVALVLAFTRGEERAAEVICRIAEHLPLVDPNTVRRLFVALGLRIRTLATQRAVLLRAVAWASANWLLDAASLWVFVGAFGHWVNPDGLLVAYGLANVLAAIPITPGGLGVVEATLTTALVGFGTTRNVAILGVVAYRLVNFWLPIPVGGAAYVSLQVDSKAASSGRGWRGAHERWAARRAAARSGVQG